MQNESSSKAVLEVLKVSEESQLYLPTTLDTKVKIPASQINPNLESNIKRMVERKFGNKFFSFGHVRPGTIKILKRSIGHKIGSSDFSGSFTFDVVFQCEVFLPQVGQEIDARVKSICKIGILAKSDNNKITVMLSKPHQTNLELFSDVMVESRIRARILDFRIDNQNSTINVIGDMVEVIEGVYQNYLLPRVDDVKIEIFGNFETTSNVDNLYINYSNFISSINSKSLMDPYSMFTPSNISMKEWNSLKRKKSFSSFKDYWRLAKSMVEDYELVHRYKGIINQLDSEKNLTFLCLGEAPGGFIQALAHYRLVEYNISSDKFHAYTLKVDNANQLWDWPTCKKALDNLNVDLNLHYGDLTLSDTIKDILNKLDGEKVDLVTADGAFTHSKVYNYEEIVNYRIFFGEIVGALVSQKIGGSFVLKIFDILSSVTRQLLLLLNHYYSEVYITKPDFSRPASSEKYVICLGFKGLETPDQNEEQAIDTLIELMDVWNDKVKEEYDIYYPENETFVLNLLSYALTEDDDFSRKFIDVSFDHIQKQTEHINRGIHLIHTRNIFDQKKVNQVKKEQLKNAINWCQRYKLNYLDDLELTKENIIDSEIINTTRTLLFSISNVNVDEQETFDYLIANYPFLSMDYLKERYLAMQERVEEIVDNYQQNEVYQYKTKLLDPVNSVNSQTKLDETNSWYSIYEILNKYVKLGGGSSKVNVLVNLDHINTQMSRALVHYLKQSKRDLDWVGSMVYSDNLPDPSNWLQQYEDHWLMNKDMNGDMRDSSNLEKFRVMFDQKKVDLYLADLRVPLDNIDMFISYPERYFLKDNLGQIFVGLNAIKDGGHMIIRQYTFFEDISIAVFAMLEDLFEKVLLTKPLMSLADSSEVYLVCQEFNLNKWTKSMQDSFLSFIGTISDDRQELMDEDFVLPSLDTKELKIGQKEIDILRPKLLYISYRINVLNQFPKIQINLDLVNNPRYQLSSVQESVLQQITSDKQSILNKSKFDEDDNNDLKKINQQMKELYSDISRKITREDFSYILDETARNWLDQNQV